MQRRLVRVAPLDTHVVSLCRFELGIVLVGVGRLIRTGRWTPLPQVIGLALVRRALELVQGRSSLDFLFLFVENINTVSLLDSLARRGVLVRLSLALPRLSLFVLTQRRGNI